MGQIAHFWPPEWLIQSSPPPLIEGHHRQLDNQCKDPMDNNKDCRVGQLTSGEEVLKPGMGAPPRPAKKGLPRPAPPRKKASLAPPRENWQNLRGGAGQSLFESLEN